MLDRSSFSRPDHATAESHTPLLPPTSAEAGRAEAPRSSKWARVPGVPTARRALAALDALPGGHPAVGAFLFSLVAYTAQTESAAWVQSGLGYRKPVLSLYLGHSTFAFILPVHLLALRWTTGSSIRGYYIPRLWRTIRWHARALPVLARPRHHASATAAEANQDLATSVLKDMWADPPPAISTGETLLRTITSWLILTLGIAVPALSWYAAVPLTRMADITALYNCFALAALVLSVWILGDELRAYKVIATAAAVGGVVVTAYGGSESEDTLYPHALLGDLLALLGAVSMGLYEVLFKLLGTLPGENMLPPPVAEPAAASSGHDEETAQGPNVRESQVYTEMEAETESELDSGTELDSEESTIHAEDSGFKRFPTTQTISSAPTLRGSEPDAESSRTGGSSHWVTQSTPTPKRSSDEEEDVDAVASGLPTIAEDSPVVSLSIPLRPRPAVRSSCGDRWDPRPPTLPFGLHASLITSAIGACTATFLWIGVVLVHLLGWERFELPHRPMVFVALASVAGFGIVFNACFSILLGLWGPVLASVSCLLTTIFVQLADTLLGSRPTLLGLVGCALILTGFCVLVWGEQKHTIAPRRRRRKRKQRQHTSLPPADPPVVST